ncbi:MAG: hypothetical protein ACI39W_06995 [Brotaphodocola sp.]
MSWLLKRCDTLAESKMDVTKEMLEASYAEEKMQSKEAKKENWSKLDTTSVLLEIEELLGIDEEHEPAESKGVKHTLFQILFALSLFGIAVVIILNGGMKIKAKVDHISRSVAEPLQGDDFVSSATGADENYTYAAYVQLGDEVVYLSENGHVLYTLPIEESDLTCIKKMNPEIQKQEGWTYYLPCQERDDTQLANVSPSYNHVLYRMNPEGKQIEIIAREVDNYTFWEDYIYVSQFGHVKRIESDQIFPKETPGIYVREMNEELYLYDSLGRTLKTDADGSITVEDSILTLSSDKVLDVHPAPRKKGQTTYLLKETEDGSAIFKSRNGREELFDTNGKSVDSFCIVGDWIYYSTYTENQKSESNYSDIYKKSITVASESEQFVNQIAGRIYQMHYSKSHSQIYADYVPESWKNNYGVIAVISLDGQISYLDDGGLRDSVETTGNDWLRFVMVQDDKVYCYWEDCFWKENEMPKAMWRKVLIISDDKKIPLEK